MISLAMVEIDNSTHIILSGGRFVIRGIPGSAAPWPCTEVLIKRGQSLCRCGLGKERHGGSVETPTWMIEPATCCRLPIMAEPIASCDALLEVKALLHVALGSAIDAVLHAPHRPVRAAGGADATVSQSPATLATDTVRSAPPASGASGAPTRRPRKDHPIGGRATPRSREPHASRRRRGTGGV